MNTPDLLKIQPFEKLRSEAITDVFLPYLTERVGAQQAKEVVRGLESPNEVSALLLDCMVLYKQKQDRKNNHKVKQLFSETATDSQMIELLVKRYNLKRQVLKPADESVFPIKPAVLETNESLLLRYALAPYGLATTGTRSGYKFHSLTLGERPLISVETESENVVLVRHEFTPTQGVKRPKDAAARMVRANSGEVEIRLLSSDGNGQASTALIDSVSAYVNRDDIAQETDTVTVKSADILNCEIEVEAKEISKPNQLVNRPALNKALKDYANAQHKLGGKIERSRLIQILHNHNAENPMIIKPQADLICDWYQAPYCIGITASVKPKEI